MKKLTPQQLHKEYPIINKAWESMSEAFIAVKEWEASSEELKNLSPEEKLSYIVNQILSQYFKIPIEEPAIPVFNYKGLYQDTTYSLS